MKSCNNQMVQKNKLMKFGKKIIGCVFIIACMTSSASAMFSRALKESNLAFRSTTLATVFSHSFHQTLAKSISTHPQKIIFRNCFTTKELSKTEQQTIVIKELLVEIPQNRMNELLKKLPHQGVDSETISVVNTLYSESNRLPDAPPVTAQESRFPQGIHESITGC